MPTVKAAILARGLGTRMRRGDPNAIADETQSRVADTGIKAMIPIGRPFLDYVISALADAGFTDICLVIGPEHDAVRAYYASIPLTRVRIHYAIQQEPRGTADAVLAAEEFANGDTIVVLNSDNDYPVHTLRALRELDACGVAAFEREALIRLGNIDAERVAKYSVVDIDDRGMIRSIVEKPDASFYESLAGDVFVGMNSWSLTPAIYDACRSIAVSPRGELELPAAVQYAIDVMNVPFHALRFHDGVLDLSTRADISSVAARLRDVEPRL
jgi:glucose-1-phosphate thymidylyltransferase